MAHNKNPSQAGPGPDANASRIVASIAGGSSKKVPELRWLLAIAVLATAASAPILIFGAPYGNDLLEHLSWLQSFTEQLRAGEIYPRWLIDLNGGAGSPAFFYYVPFAYYVSAVTGSLFCPGCGPSMHLAIGMWLMVLASGMAFYLFARQYAPPWIATLGAFAYMLMPYHYEIDLWRRLAFTEIAAYIWMPLILLSLHKAFDDRRFLPALAASYAALVVSHLPSAMIFGLFLGGYALMECYWRRSARPMILLGVAAALGIALAAVYLVPAVFAEGYIVSADMFVPHANPQGQFWTYEYFDYRNWMFLDGLPEPNNKLTKRILALLLGVTGVFTLSCIAIYRARSDDWLRTSVPWFFGMMLVWLMVTPLSIPVWELFSPLKKMQFPFRFLILTDLALAMTIVVALRAVVESGDRLSRLVLGTAAALFVVVGGSGASNVLGFRPAQYLLEPFQSAEVVEDTAAGLAAGFDPIELFGPVWMNVPAQEFREIIGGWPQVSVRPQAGDAQVLRWRARDIVLHADLQTDSVIEVKQLYFPGWRASDTSTGAELAVSPGEPLGLVRVAAPAGRYEIELRLEPLWQERVGYAVSILALLTLLVMIYLGKRRSIDNLPVTGK